MSDVLTEDRRREPDRRAFLRPDMGRRRTDEPKAPCPRCGAATRVSDSRGLVRTRRCINAACGARYITDEVLRRFLPARK